VVAATDVGAPASAAPAADPLQTGTSNNPNQKYTLYNFLQYNGSAAGNSGYQGWQSDALTQFKTYLSGGYGTDAQTAANFGTKGAAAFAVPIAPASSQAQDLITQSNAAAQAKNVTDARNNNSSGGFGTFLGIAALVALGVATDGFGLMAGAGAASGTVAGAGLDAVAGAGLDTAASAAALDAGTYGAVDAGVTAAAGTAAAAAPAASTSILSNPYAVGAAKGALISAMTGRDPITGALVGAATGGVGSAVGNFIDPSGGILGQLGGAAVSTAVGVGVSNALAPNPSGATTSPGSVTSAPSAPATDLTSGGFASVSALQFNPAARSTDWSTPRLNYAGTQGAA
jgi:hypothetical protein